MARNITQILRESESLQPREHAAGHRPTIICTEWTPSIETSVPIRSTWRDAVGPVLTNHTIRKYALEGRYGDRAKLNEIKRLQSIQDEKERKHERERLKTRRAKYWDAFFEEYQ